MNDVEKKIKKLLFESCSVSVGKIQDNCPSCAALAAMLRLAVEQRDGYAESYCQNAGIGLEGELECSNWQIIAAAQKVEK